MYVVDGRLINCRREGYMLMHSNSLQVGCNLVSPFDLVQGILSSEIKKVSACATDTSLYEFLRDKVLQRNLSQNIVQESGPGSSAVSLQLRRDISCLKLLRRCSHLIGKIIS
jgi:hypothetical protein